jgi:cysteine synthase A
MTGSIKDRMAYHILRRAIETGELEPGGRIIEATSGNTGISFCAIGRALGHPVTIFMPDWMSAERIAIIRSFGADDAAGVQGAGRLPRLDPAGRGARGGDTGRFLPAAVRQRAELRGALPHHRARDLGAARIGARGADRVRRRRGHGRHDHGGRALPARAVPRIKVHPVEPANSPTLTTGHKVGKHRIQGISDEFIPPIVHLEQLDA